MIKFNIKRKFNDFIRDAQIKSNILFSKHLRAPVSKWLNRYRFNCLAPINKTIYIDVDNIHGWYLKNLFSGFSFQGQILPGDWDLNIIPKDEKLEGFPKYIGIRERYLEEKKWIDTKLFRHYRHLLEHKNRTAMGKNSIHEIETYYEENIDPLFNNIKENGILPAGEKNSEIAPLYVHISRNGELIYTNEGNHRLSMAIILNLKKIPVQVWKRHQQWQQKREIILGKREVPEKLKLYLNHPDILGELHKDP